METIVISTPSFQNESPSSYRRDYLAVQKTFSADCTVFDTDLVFRVLPYQTADSRNTPQACKKSRGHIETTVRRHLEQKVVPNFLDIEMTIISKRVISNRISSIISKRQPQGIERPAALRAFSTSFYSFSFSHIFKMPCGTALSAVASEPFLSHLRRG